MFYYAEIDSNYLVVATHALEAESTNENYIEITQAQYDSGETIGKYGSKLNGTFGLLAIGDAVGTSAEVAYHGNSVMPLSIKLDNLEVEMQAEIDGKADSSHTHSEYANGDHTHSANEVTGLSTVATSGNYNDLSNKPTIPSAYTHPESHPASMITGLAEVATSGSYEDLADKPTIPTVPNSLPANGGNADTVDNKHASDFATAEHTHEQADITGLASALSGKANATHSHTEYVTNDTYAEEMEGKANATHTHAQSEIAGLSTALNGKANATHSHSDYATKSELNALSESVDGKANSSHTHAQGDITGLATALSGKANSTHNHNNATTSANGFMSSTDKSKLDGIATGANKTVVDTALSSSSTNPVQNKVINTALAGKSNTGHTHTLDSVSETTDKKIMTAAERTKLSGIATGANKYTHPAYTAKSSGLYKVTVDATGHISGATAVAKSDITALGIPSTNTTYGNATTSAAGLMSSSDKSKLDGIASGANKTTVDSALSSTSTNPVQNKVINSALAGKAASSHTHELSAVVGLLNLLLTDANGKQKTTITGNVLTTIANLSVGVHTAYSGGGTNATATNAPNTIESWRYLIHKNYAAYGWVLAFGSEGSFFINYLDNGTWRGWKPIWDNNPAPLWSGAVFMNSNQTVTPSKKLNECKNGWILLWSDYDTANGGATNGDVVASYVPKRCYDGGNWGGHSWLVDIPAEASASAETRCIKKVYIWNNRIQGNAINEQNSRNDVVLRAVYEF